MKDFIISFTVTVIALSLMIALVYSLVMYADMPEVYRSYSTGKCTKIKYKGKDIPCADLKAYPKYINIWVE